MAAIATLAPELPILGPLCRRVTIPRVLSSLTKRGRGGSASTLFEQLAIVQPKVFILASTNHIKYLGRWMLIFMDFIIQMSRP